jgi:hypothetical protein
MINLADVPEYFEKYKKTFFEVTEFCEGLKVTYTKNKKGAIVFTIVNLKEATTENITICSSLIEKCDMEKAFQNYPKNMIIEGLIIGKGIKGNCYNKPTFRFLMHDVTTAKTKKHLTTEHRVDIFNDFLLNEGKLCHVPLICDEIQLFSEFTPKTLLDFVKENSLLNKNIQQKGIACKSLKKISGKVLEFKVLNA